MSNAARPANEEHDRGALLCRWRLLWTATGPLGRGPRHCRGGKAISRGVETLRHAFATPANLVRALYDDLLISARDWRGPRPDRRPRSDVAARFISNDLAIMHADASVSVRDRHARGWEPDICGLLEEAEVDLGNDRLDFSGRIQ